uniref:PIH1D1/2/3 CS-like domain-containing protein n=2 Tax=Leptocylindrus danicus TaxID=163516 RepID=A0A7S2KXK8_9STRA
MEADKAGNLVSTFDSCYHPETLRLAANAGFRDMLAQMISDSLVKTYRGLYEEISVDAAYRVLRNVIYVNGTPPAMLISVNGKTNTKNDLNCDEKEEEGIEANSEGRQGKKWSQVGKVGDDSRDENMKPASTMQKVASGLEHEMEKGFFMKARKTTYKDKNIALCKTSKDVKPDENGLIVSSRENGMAESRKETPQYTISERSDFDIGDHTMANVPKNDTGKILVIRVKLPKVLKTSEIDLLVNDKSLMLKSLDGSKSNYLLEIDLPRKVNSESGSKAAWDKTSKELTLTLPICIHRPPKLIVDTEKYICECEVPDKGQGTAEDKTPKTSNTSSTKKKEGDTSGHVRWVESSVSFQNKQIACKIDLKEVDNQESREPEKWNEYCKQSPVEDLVTASSSPDSDSDSDYVHVEPVSTACDHSTEKALADASTSECSQNHPVLETCEQDQSSNLFDGSNNTEGGDLQNSDIPGDSLKNLFDQSPVMQNKLMFALD